MEEVNSGPGPRREGLIIGNGTEEEIEVRGPVSEDVPAGCILDRGKEDSLKMTSREMYRRWVLGSTHL